MKLRFPGKCAACGTALDRGVPEYWDAQARLVYCISHVPDEAQATAGIWLENLTAGSSGSRRPS